MKVAIVSDMHIGYERFYEDAYNQAHEALSKAAEISDAIIIPGDIFDFRHPKPDVLAQGLKLFRKLKERNWNSRITKYSGSGKIYTDIPIIAIPGTHERRAQDSENAVELLNIAGFLANGSEATIEITKGDETISISSLGGVSEERVKEMLQTVNFHPQKNKFNIFMFHQSIYELLPFSEDFIHYDDLPEGFDLYVNGHIHSKVVGSVHGKPFLIPGSTVLTQLKDGEQEQKGFFVFDTVKKSYEFHGINSREFIVEKIDISNKKPDQIKSEILNAIEKDTNSKTTKPIIRIVISGKMNSTTRQMDLDIHEILKKEGGKAVLEISKNNVEDEETTANIEALRKRSMENISIKDYGLALFLERIKANGYKLDISASDLFDLLTSENSKEKALNKALSSIFQQH